MSRTYVVVSIPRQAPFIVNGNLDEIAADIRPADWLRFQRGELVIHAQCSNVSIYEWTREDPPWPETWTFATFARPK